ncbi:MAG TPA: lysophospholipid acyltransferase family protein [Polyangiaceae bacterium]|nr:lysophospholipid acyltransferase family protein [Polyangiaceae bacterium]
MTLVFAAFALLKSGVAARIAAWTLAACVGDVLRIRRAHVEAAMTRAGVRDPSRTARAMYGSLSRGLLELLAMAFARPAERLSNEFPWPAIDAIVGEGRGAVIATAHTGSWDLVACAVASRVPLTVVTKRLSMRWLDRVWQRLRASRGLKLAQVGSAAAAAGRALRRGELVAMLVDQAPERARGATAVSFLGATAWVDLSPALCAARARAPLVVAFPRRLDDGTHTVDIAAVLRPPRTPARGWAVEAMTETTRLLEAFVAAHPDQWLWMHRRWKPAPVENAGRARALAGVSS